jgi:ATP-binding protein involved in chromosome partitioning
VEDEARSSLAGRVGREKALMSITNKPVDEETRKREALELQQRMAKIKHKFLVLSGKGGVGKSTVAVNVAVALAKAGRQVGLLDVDIHGPSVPKLTGLEGRTPESDGEAFLPVRVADNLAVMSIGFLLTSSADAVIWRGPLKYKVISEFLRDVAWGMLDYLVIDCPPGTGDEPLSVAQLAGPDAEAIIVTTPQELSISDVRRCVTFCRQVNLSVLGILENMSGFICPQCGARVDLFKVGGGETLSRETSVPFLGRIPFDPEIVASGDNGIPFADGDAARSSVAALRAIVERLLGHEHAAHQGCKTEKVR